MPRRAGLPFTSRHRSAVLPLDDLGPDTPDTPHMATVDGPVKVDSKRRRYLAMLSEVKLESFLRSHGFDDLDSPKMMGCLFKDVIYPIHVAARLGDCEAIRLLLNADADPNQKTGRGRTPLEDKRGSHAEAVLLLWQPTRVRSARELLGQQSEPMRQ
eukprot:symbB.v1.2.003891.t1/scaffold217.1/size263214/1